MWKYSNSLSYTIVFFLSKNLFFKIWRMETLFWPCQSRASNVFKQWRFYLTDLIHVSFLHKYGVVLTLPKEQKWLCPQCEMLSKILSIDPKKFLKDMPLLSNLDGKKDPAIVSKILKMAFWYSLISMRQLHIFSN